VRKRVAAISNSCYYYGYYFYTLIITATLNPCLQSTTELRLHLPCWKYYIPVDTKTPHSLLSYNFLLRV